MIEGRATESNRDIVQAYVQLPHPNPEVVFRRVGDGGVLLSMADEVYFGLNTVGAEIWERLPPRTGTLEELCSALADRYPEVDAEVLRTDTTELLHALANQRLVTWPADLRIAAGGRDGPD